LHPESVTTENQQTGAFGFKNVFQFFTEVFRKIYLAAIIAGILTLLSTSLCGCSRSKTEEQSEDTQIQAVSESYHADNDIAMTVRSIADAIRVGEPLDSLGYDFNGILTDGSGRPLYTDMSGAPGQWIVDVTSPTSVSIRNIRVGDLLPGDLERYLVQSLELNSNALVAQGVRDRSEIVVYDFGGGFLRIETEMATASNGMEGALMNIVASKSTPI